MLAGLRRVRQLVLESPADCARRGAFLIEDALRTAALPGSERQLILVRALALGRIDARESPVALARRIERKWNQLARYAVPATSSEVTFAPAVTFRSREHAFALYLAKVLRGNRPVEWFWRQVVSPQAERESGAELFVALARTCASAPAGEALRILDLLEEIERTGVLPLLAAALETQHVEEAWSLLFPGAPLEPGEEIRIDPPWEAIPIPPLYRRIVDRLIDRRAEGMVVTWTAAMAVLAARPRLVSSPGRLAAAARQIERSLRPARRLSPPQAQIAPPTTSEGPVAEIVEPPPASSPLVELPSTPARVPAKFSPIPESPSEAGDTAPDGELLASAAFETELTNAGGLFFVLPVLDRLGFAPGHAGLLSALLHNIARSTQTPLGDPILAGLGEPLPHAAVRHWRRRVRRYLRATVKMSLRRLVRRTATVVITRTHADIFFALEHADIRIRRHGLDIDPGWVPALGKVIVYRYGEA